MLEQQPMGLKVIISPAMCMVFFSKSLFLIRLWSSITKPRPWGFSSRLSSPPYYMSKPVNLLIRVCPLKTNQPTPHTHKPAGVAQLGGEGTVVGSLDLLDDGHSEARVGGWWRKVAVVRGSHARGLRLGRRAEPAQMLHRHRSLRLHLSAQRRQRRLQTEHVICVPLLRRQRTSAAASRCAGRRSSAAHVAVEHSQQLGLELARR